MGEAAGHKFGQFIGEYCELAIEPLLREFADRHGLFLDKAGSRPARSGTKVKWIDAYGNSHNLDYVLERGGTQQHIGMPVAFIESAWRRYTKHSRNKAQEIQGAVLPIRDKHSFSAPFMGCILAGVYTAGALDQLRSSGFKLLYFTYESVVEAFAAVGVDAHFDEATADADFVAKMARWNRVRSTRRGKVWETLLELNRRNVDEFMLQLERAVQRLITAVRVTPLHGAAKDCITVNEAIAFVDAYDEQAATGPLVKYEVVVRYDNGDKIDAQFQDRSTTVEFLRAYQTGNWTPAINAHDDDVE
ncbi:MAG TPA: hypothetical protein VM165_22130 [Planctomycetaceae bacterium]|nr:hypothetical protein [Planctomycetaceae bacterium]